MIKHSLTALAGTAALAAALAAMVQPAVAQSIRSPYEFVEPAHGAWAFGSYIFTERGVLDLGPGSGPAVGVGYNFRISGPFNVAGAVSFFPTDRRVYDVVPVDSAELREDPRAGTELIGTADLSLLLLDAALRFDITGPRTWNRIQPYALIGAGGAIRVSGTDATEEDLPADLWYRFRSGVSAHVGGGVEIYAARRLTLRLDARNLLWRVHVPQGFLDQGRVLDDTEWVQNGHLSVGASFRF